MRKGTRWKSSAEHKGQRIFNGRVFMLYDSCPTKTAAKALAKRLKADRAGRATLVTKSLYFGDWNVWLSSRVIDERISHPGTK